MSENNFFITASCFILKQRYDDITNLDTWFDQSFQRQIWVELLWNAYELKVFDHRR